MVNFGALSYKQFQFKCIIISPHRIIYESEVSSLFIQGDKGEYELLAYHYPLLGVVKKSDVIIDNTKKVAIAGGIVRFFANECVIMVEEQQPKIKISK